MKPRPRDEGGFALVESLSTTAFAVLALTGGLIMLYVSFAHLWLKRAAYETTICLSTPAATSKCRAELETSTAQALPIGALEEIRLGRSRAHVETKFRWHMGRGLSLAIEDRRPLPLLGPDSALKVRR